MKVTEKLSSIENEHFNYRSKINWINKYKESNAKYICIYWNSTQIKISSNTIYLGRTVFEFMI